MSSTLRKLILPGQSSEEKQVIELDQSVLIIGANGSGKTRFGSWIELGTKQERHVHRISAQKSLSMPDSITPMSIDIAEKMLLFGSADRQDLVAHYRWKQNPATNFLNDYDKLMIFLFSDETEENAKYKAASLKSDTRIEPVKTRLDKVKKVWESVLPHRELVVGGLRIETRVKDSPSATYKSSEMSDGERVILYLIGQCLAAPKNGIIIIDEPELHLHKSIQTRLWLEIEKLRSDCIFVYLTHDIDFAVDNQRAKKIWLKSFDGKYWDWEYVQSDCVLPEDLLYKLLGSRKPVVFVEGDAGSYETALIRSVLPNYLVIPRGSCTQVIQSVNALKATPQLHHMDVYGLIDRDRRVETEIKALENKSIVVMKVAEIENLFCTKEVLAIVSRRMARDASADFATVSDAIFRKLELEFEKQVSLHVISEIKFQLKHYNENSVGQENLKQSLDALTNSIDVQQIYLAMELKFRAAIKDKDYETLLAIYNRKSLASQVGSALGLAKNELPELVVRLSQSENAEELHKVLLDYIGLQPDNQ